MASKKSSKGKRYTDTEKQKIIDFVTAHNSAKGRGGAAAASRKFKVSQLTIGNWLKKSGAKPVAKKAAKKAAKRKVARKVAKRKGAKRKVAKRKVAAKRGRRPGRKAGVTTSRSKALAALNKVDQKISAKRKELAVLEAAFDKLIKSL